MSNGDTKGDNSWCYGGIPSAPMVRVKGGGSWDVSLPNRWQWMAQCDKFESGGLRCLRRGKRAAPGESSPEDLSFVYIYLPSSVRSSG